MIRDRILKYKDYKKKRASFDSYEYFNCELLPQYVAVRFVERHFQNCFDHYLEHQVVVVGVLVVVVGENFGVSCVGEGEYFGGCRCMEEGGYFDSSCVEEGDYHYLEADFQDLVFSLCVF